MPQTPSLRLDSAKYDLLKYTNEFRIVWLVLPKDMFVTRAHIDSVIVFHICVLQTYIKNPNRQNLFKINRFEIFRTVKIRSSSFHRMPGDILAVIAAPNTIVHIGKQCFAGKSLKAVLP